MSLINSPFVKDVCRQLSLMTSTCVSCSGTGRTSFSLENVIVLHEKSTEILVITHFRFLAIPVHSRQQIKVISTDPKVPLNVSDVVAEISTASGKKIPVKLAPSPDGTVILANFIPTEIGENLLVVRAGNTAIPKTPQKFSVSPNPDPSKVKVEGPGILNGEPGVPAKFRIDTRKAGVAPLGLTIDGPAEAKIDTVDNKDGTVDVTYHPVVPGDYAVNVVFADKPVPGSPFHPKIASKIDTSSLIVEGLDQSKWTPIIHRILNPTQLITCTRG